MKFLSLNPRFVVKINPRRRSLALLLGGMVAAGTLFAAEAGRTDDRVTVRFFEPEKFTDLKENGTDFENERGRGHFPAILRKHLESRVARHLAPGQSLAITFTDIDLAGDFEAGRGLAFYDIRIVRDMYPPRLTFSFKLTGADGQVLREGERKLVDSAFLMRGAGGMDSDSLRYEKALLDDWLRKEFSAGRNRDAHD